MKSSRNLPSERIPRAALISPDASFRTLITSCLDQATPSVEWVLRAESDVTELRPDSVERLAERRPEILFLDVGSSQSAGVNFVSAAAARLPGLTIVAAGGALGVDELLELIRAGASGYLRRPWSREEVTEVCSNLLRKMPRQADAEGPGHSGTSHVIALFAPKGGTGVSTLAANLAVHIRRATTKRTLVVDLSPQLGTCSVLMGMEPRYSYLDIVESLERMDERLLYTFLDEHESGAWVLASPGDAAMSRSLSPASVAASFRLLRRYFEYVIVDVGRGTIDGAAESALELADEVLLVTTGELPTLRNVKQTLPYVPGAGDPTETIRLVVNRYEEGLSVPKKDIERAVGLPLFQVLEEDRERVARSVNLGQPIVLNGSSPYARAVAKLGDRLAGDDVLRKGGKSSLGGLLRKVLPPFGRRDRSEAGANGRPAGASPPRRGSSVRGAPKKGGRPAGSERTPTASPRHPAPPKGRGPGASGSGRRMQEDVV